jgi:hypothetical protein
MTFEPLMPLFIVLLPVILVVAALRFVRQQTEARYRVLLQLADKGVDLPLAVLAGQHQPHADRRCGLVLICGGIGLMLSLQLLPVQGGEGQHLADLWGLGLLPVMLGLGYLGNWWLDQRAGEMRGS